MSFFRKLLRNRNVFWFVTRTKNHGDSGRSPALALVQEAWSREANSRRRALKAFVIACSGYLTYKIVKDKLTLIPPVNAAAIFRGDLLSGRRQQFNFIADVVESAAPSVVYIEIKDPRRVDFFTGRPITISNGSGFIIESNGLIVTNAHVVTNKSTAKVEVKLINGKTYNGVVEDLDLKSDLATVRIPATNLPIMKLGSSADLKPGEFVVAIGSPLTLSNTVTSGVVSSAQRNSEELGLTGRDMIYIQTDAAITFGNSGGPLVNLDGEAIGVNSMKVTPGISFAIPIDYVKIFLANTKGKGGGDAPKKLYMGITTLTLTPQIVNELMQRQEILVPNDFQGGVLVWKVILGSPAHVGGIQPGDIVTHINGQQIKSANDVYDVLKRMTAKNLKMSVTRNGRKFDISVQPEDLE